MNYSDFLKSKTIVDKPSGFEADESLIPSASFPFQRDIIKWACRRGRSALFEDCGLGKTIQQLAWSKQVLEFTQRPVLILAPNEVCRQTVKQGEQFGITVNHVRENDQVFDGINITNYERIHKFDCARFAGVVLDESSILKSYDGETRNRIVSSFAQTPYKLACTATPAPNDFMELGNHAEFLGVMNRTEMLATFFFHDGGNTSKWRLKRHAQKDFWRWLCSWAVNIRKPSDLGYDDAGFDLPPLEMHEHIVESNQKMDGYLFALPASSLQERREARRESLNERVQKAASIVSLNPSEQWFFWCNLNLESESIAEKLKSEEIRGATEESERERITDGFLNGRILRVVSKPSLYGFGINLQNCHNTILIGISDSYEEFYQVIRRFWRFGQQRPVNAHIIISSLEGAVLANIKRKELAARQMADEMVGYMSDISSAEIKSLSRESIEYNPTQPMRLPEFFYDTKKEIEPIKRSNKMPHPGTRRKLESLPRRQRGDRKGNSK